MNSITKIAFGVLFISSLALADFTRNHSKEVVTDTKTNLMWQDDASVKTTKKTWSEAVSYCDNLSFAGFSDWRLPSKMELLGITDKKGEMLYDIPGKSNFKIVSAEVEKDNNQVLLLNFSDPLNRDQDFSGLVQVESALNLRFATAGNLLKVFFNEPLKGELLVEVFQGIESEDGYKMKQNFSEKVTFEQVKPGVRFIKSGTILPSSNNLKINFESVNLSAVDVKVYQIYKNNILQFLQDNELNGSQNLRKVAQPIVKKTIALNKNKLQNSSKWNAYAIETRIYT